MSGQLEHRGPSDDGSCAAPPLSAETPLNECSGEGSDLTPLATPDARTETEPAVSEARLCAFCGTSIGRLRPQARFCSDKCRARWSRQQHARRVDSLLDTLIRTADDLRRELASPSGLRPTSDHQSRVRNRKHR